MKKYLTFSALFFLFALNAYYQNTDVEKEKAVKACIQKLFEGMQKSDTSLIRTVFHKETRMQTVLTGTGTTTPQLITDYGIDKFLLAISKAPAGSLDERITSYEIKIDGAMAAVWTPYMFYYNGTLNHCGVNAFQLCETENGWKIVQVMDTRRKEKCE